MSSLRLQFLVVACVLIAAMPLTGQTTESASTVQLWSAPVGGYYHLAVSPTGAPTLIATAYGALQKVDPQTGAATVMLPYQTHNVGFDSAIWVSNSGDLVANSGDFVISAFQDFAAFSVLSLSPGGSANWDYSMGCCQYWAFALDSPGGKGYYQANGVLYIINLINGTQMGPFSSLQDGFGFASVASPNMVYTAGVGGDVNQIDPTVSNYPDTFVSVASGQSLSPGAIAADGSIVVATIPSPCNFTNLCPGSLARVVPGPSLKWSFPVGAITPPVIGRQGYIYVGVQISAATNSTPYQGAIQAYDQNGNQVWSANLDPGLYATDVIVGNDGLVYAVASDAPYQTYSAQGELIELDQATGQNKQTVTN